MSNYCEVLGASMAINARALSFARQESRVLEIGFNDCMSWGVVNLQSQQFSIIGVWRQKGEMEWASSELPKQLGLRYRLSCCINDGGPQDTSSRGPQVSRSKLLNTGLLI